MPIDIDTLLDWPFYGDLPPLLTFDEVYLYRRPVQIDPVHGSIPIGHPIEILFPAALSIDVGKVRPDLKDIAVVFDDDGTWVIVPYSVALIETDLQIRFATPIEITALTSNQFYVYYGNADLTFPVLTSPPFADSVWPILSNFNSKEWAFIRPGEQWIQGISSTANSVGTFVAYAAQIRLLVSETIDSGVMSYRFDRGEWKLSDLYSRDPISDQVVFTALDLDSSLHRLEVRPSGLKDARATGFKLILSRAEWAAYMIVTLLAEQQINDSAPTVITPPPLSKSGWAAIAPPPFTNDDIRPDYAAPLADGTILVGASYDPTTGASQPFWIYDPASDTYTPTGGGVSGVPYRGMVAGATIGADSFAFSDVSTGAEKYNGGSWSAIASLVAVDPFGPGKAACTDGTTVYILDSGAGLIRYDPGPDSYTPLSFPNIGPFMPSLAVISGGGLYLFTSNFDDVPHTTRYDIGTDTWDSGFTLAGNPNSCIGQGAGGIIDGSVYLVGGTDGGAGGTNPLAALGVYDLGADSWTVGPPMDVALSMPIAAVQGGKLYVFGFSPGNRPVGANVPVGRVYTP